MFIALKPAKKEQNSGQKINKLNCLSVTQTELLIISWWFFYDLWICDLFKYKINY